MQKIVALNREKLKIFLSKFTRVKI